jgi:hypothetical protein
MIILKNKKTKEAFEIVPLMWDNDYIREFDSESDSYEDDYDFFGVAQIQYKLYNTKSEVKRHAYMGWSWDLETRKANSAINFNNSINEYAKHLINTSFKGFEIID